MVQLDSSVRARAAVTDVAYSSLHASAQTDGGGALVCAVLGALRQHVGGDSAGFYRHTYGGMTTALQIDPTPLWKAIPAPELPSVTACEIHLGVRHFMRHRPSAPFAVTDVVSERQWLSSELVSAMRADWGRNHQLAIPIDDAAANTRHVWLVGRTTTGFSAADREIAVAVQPLLAAITRHYLHLPRAAENRFILVGLTAREQAIAELLSGNEPTAVIARRLRISARTVQKHTERIYRKLEIHDRQALRLQVQQHAPSAGPRSHPFDPSG